MTLVRIPPNKSHKYDLTRELFYRLYGASKNVARFAPKPARGTMMAERNKRLAIMEGAKRLCMIAFRYKKVSGKIDFYEVEPYSYRYRNLRQGTRKVLFGYHRNPNDRKNSSIKMFVLNGIKNVRILHKRYRPRWRVEF